MAFVIKDGSEEPLVFQSEEELKNWANNNGFWYKNGTVIVPQPDNGPSRRYKVSEERIPTFSVVDNNTYQGGQLKGLIVTKSKPKKTGGQKAREDVWGKGNPVWGSDRVRGVVRLERRNPKYADDMRKAMTLAGALVDPRVAASAAAAGLTYVAAQYGPAIVDGLRSGVEYVGKLANDAFGTIQESRRNKNKGNNKGNNKKPKQDPAEDVIDDAVDIDDVANKAAGAAGAAGTDAAAGTAAAGATPPTNPNDEDQDSNTRESESRSQQNQEIKQLRQQLRDQEEAHQREIQQIREEMQRFSQRRTPEPVSDPSTPVAEPTPTTPTPATPTKGPWLFKQFRRFSQTPAGKVAGRIGQIAVAEQIGATGLDVIDNISGAIGERSGRKSDANWNATKYWSPAGWLYQWSTSEATPGDSLKSEVTKQSVATKTDSIQGTTEELSGANTSADTSRDLKSLLRSKNRSSSNTDKSSKDKTK